MPTFVAKLSLGIEVLAVGQLIAIETLKVRITVMHQGSVRGKIHT